MTTVPFRMFLSVCFHQTMKVTIRTVSQARHKLYGVKPKSTVAEVKVFVSDYYSSLSVDLFSALLFQDMIEKNLKLGSAGQIRLIFDGKALRDTQSIADANVYCSLIPLSILLAF